MTEEQIQIVMIDKQKLIKWIEEEIYINLGPYDTLIESTKHKAAINILRKLDMHITAGSLDVEEVVHERTTEISASVART